MMKIEKSISFKQWIDGKTISKKPNQMTDKELIDFTEAGAVVIISRMKTLAPYLMEVRRRFNRLERGETLCGYSNWGEFCTEHLKKTKRALNYMLAGGNKARPQLTEGEKQELLAKVEEKKKSDYRDWTTRIELGKELENIVGTLREANKLLEQPTTATQKKEIQKIITSAVELLTKTMTRFGIFPEKSEVGKFFPPDVGSTEKTGKKVSIGSH
jgi:hypothetical protein